MARRQSPFTSDERPLGAVPAAAIAVLAASLALQAGTQWLRGQPIARAAALQAPATEPVLRVLSMGEPVALAQGMTLYLQAFDNQPGISVPFAELDYPRVAAWLTRILRLDPVGQYPLMMASQLYAQVPDESRQRLMLNFVHQEFQRDPDRRWRWLAHAAIIAKHRLKDMPLALRYATDIAQQASGASNWARQMRIFILEDMGETDSAAVLLGGLLESGEVSDPTERRFLLERLGHLKDGGKSTGTSKFRRPEMN